MNTACENIQSFTYENYSHIISILFFPDTNSVIQLKHLNAGSPHHIIKHKKSYCSQCFFKKIAKLENDLYELEKKYTEEKRVTSELKKENVACKQELQILRYGTLVS